MKKLIFSAKKKPAFDKSRRSFLQYTGAGILTTSLFLAGCSDDDEPGIEDIAAPSNLTATQNDAGDIELSFTNNATDADGFIVERSENRDTGFAEIGRLGTNETTFTDTADNLTPGTEYFYRIAATRGNEQSVFSEVISSMGGTALVVLPGGDAGILNYAYALEQLEAAFYTQVMENNFFSGATDQEMRILEDLRKHEVAHRDFFEAAISTVAEPIPGLMVDFSSVDFADRASVLGTARTFENLGVAAYNGAGKLLENPDYLTVAGKIVSVEARHAAAIEDLIDPMSTAFVDVVSAQGLDQAFMPSEVLAAADPFILTRIDASNLPTA